MDITISKNTIVVFDLDDTLYNEVDFLISAYTEIAKKSSPKDWKLLFVDMFSRYRHKLDVFGFLSEELNIPKDHLIDIYRNHTPQIEPKHKVRSVFKKIKENKGRIAIITDGRTITQQQKIAALNIQKYLDLVIISEETGFEKPHKNNFQLVESTFKNGDYYYIADNFKKDFIAPNALGWTTIGVIDNGLNIHYDAYNHLDQKSIPKNLIFSFGELVIK